MESIITIESYISDKIKKKKKIVCIIKLESIIAIESYISDKRILKKELCPTIFLIQGQMIHLHLCYQ